MRAEEHQAALDELTHFQEEYEAKYPKAIDCLTKEVSLFTSMDYPATYWLHLHTTNSIESTFDTVKARPQTSKSDGSRYVDLAIAFITLTQAKKRKRRVNSPHLVALVAADVRLPDSETQALPNLPPESVVNLQVDTALRPAILNIRQWLAFLKRNGSTYGRIINN